jgi:hypothetical protein
VEVVPQRNGLAFYQECREGTTIVPFKGTTSAQKEQQLFHQSSKEQIVPFRHAKGTTIVPFKGTTGAQKEQQLFRSKEQQARKRNKIVLQRNNRRTKGTTIVQRNNNC